jgi:hypothetical protein
MIQERNYSIPFISFILVLLIGCYVFMSNRQYSTDFEKPGAMGPLAPQIAPFRLDTLWKVVKVCTLLKMS